ncbi:hypothetical protein C9J60_31465 [Streptomyces sp. A244]|nr:hypothetical protein C9J60_31465 [Streptomyces sp. A244]
MGRHKASGCLERRPGHDRAGQDLGSDAVRAAVRQLPLLTSRRHIDLVRVCGAASLTSGRCPLSDHA